ncbi:hypothetical protein AGMMS50267_12790 [Spirochaetia bacterium]|nr:hypothetical protein AGMMS50267_12790 [Spirochaetia bacterium]
MVYRYMTDHKGYNDNEKWEFAGFIQKIVEWGHFVFTLASITLGKGLKPILSSAFSNNGTLTAIVIPDGVTEIGGNAFSNCWLSSITWGKGLLKIGGNAFEQNNLTEIIIPNGVTYIDGNNAFANNPLTTITLPASLARYESGRSGFSYAFSNTVPVTVTRITVPTNMDEGMLRGFPDGFLNFWKSQNKAAGTYVLKGRLWAKQ